MKRRKFLVSSILLGLGLFLMPLKASADNSVIIPLPDAEAHGSHGNVDLNSIQGLTFPTGVSNVRFQRFLKNGYTEGPEDLCIVSFEYDGEAHIVQFKFYELCEKGYIDCSGSKKNNTKVFRLM